ncbi:hypothetical protein L573_1853 [Bordetella holmesii H620]|nr:hypothetical protein L573_1853 [Bordetella holmesii H620]
MADPQRCAGRSERDGQPDHGQNQAMLFQKGNRLRPCRQANASNKNPQTQFLEQTQCGRRDMAQRRPFGRNPTADQAADQRTAPTTERQWQTCHGNHQTADTQPEQNPPAHEDNIGCSITPKLIAQMLDGIAKIGIGAHQPDHVAIHHHRRRGHRNTVATAFYALQKHPSRRARLWRLGEMRERAAVDMLAADDDLALLQIERIGMRGRHLDFGADHVIAAQGIKAQPDNHHDIAGLQDLFRSRRQRFAVTQQAGDHRTASQGLLYLQHGFPGGLAHDVRPAHKARQGRHTAVFFIRHTAQLGFQILARLPQIDAQQQRSHLTGEQHDADRAYQIGQRVSRRDVGFLNLHLLSRQAQMTQRFGRGAHNGRLGRRTRGQTRRGARIETEKARCQQRNQQYQHHLDERQHHETQAGAVEIGEKARATRIAHGKDEEHEGNLTHGAFDLAACLAQDHRDDQGAAYAAQRDRP